jgi:hypothetical protein
VACLQAARSSSNHAIPLPNSPSCPAFSLAPNPLASQDLPSLLSSHLSSLPLPVDRQRRPLLARHALYVWVAFGRPTLSSSRGNANRLDGDDLSLASRKVLRDGLCTQPRSRSHQLLGDRCTTKRAKGRGGKKGKGGGTNLQRAPRPCHHSRSRRPRDGMQLHRFAHIDAPSCLPMRRADRRRRGVRVGGSVRGGGAWGCRGGGRGSVVVNKGGGEEGEVG